jgi:hypothetical protein
MTAQHPLIAAVVCARRAAVSAKDDSKLTKIPKEFHADLCELERLTTTSIEESKRKHVYSRLTSFLPWAVQSIKVLSSLISLRAVLLLLKPQPASVPIFLLLPSTFVQTRMKSLHTKAQADDLKRQIEAQIEASILVFPLSLPPPHHPLPFPHPPSPLPPPPSNRSQPCAFRSFERK